MSFWDILAWVALFLIVVWLVLKTFGIISTPAYLEYAPIYGAVYIAGWAMSTLVRATQDINGLKRNLSFLNKKVIELDKDMEFIKMNYTKKSKKLLAR